MRKRLLENKLRSILAQEKNSGKTRAAQITGKSIMLIKTYRLVSLVEIKVQSINRHSVSSTERLRKLPRIRLTYLRTFLSRNKQYVKYR